ncbi:hypothetical protein B0H16DRAFT_1462925 [Mycena metata]|uniref:Uncharacterized protein n=1 Tax=Mycena metata TaxID=1033252 RepID=A0AAD7N4E9_9AGAR|nr:hypothetical protein B0H16DRAFT_1462925 [Mycena metata]
MLRYSPSCPPRLRSQPPDGIARRRPAAPPFPFSRESRAPDAAFPPCRTLQIAKDPLRRVEIAWDSPRRCTYNAILRSPSSAVGESFTATVSFVFAVVRMGLMGRCRGFLLRRRRTWKSWILPPFAGFLNADSGDPVCLLRYDFIDMDASFGDAAYCYRRICKFLNSENWIPIQTFTAPNDAAFNDFLATLKGYRKFLKDHRVVSSTAQDLF